MKVLLICIALTVKCYAVDEPLNITTTATLETPEFKSSKIVDQTQPSTKSTVYNVTTEKTPNRINSIEKSAILKKKPFTRLRNQKKVLKNNLHTENTYKVHESKEDNSEPKLRYTSSRPRLNINEDYRRTKIPYEKSKRFNEYQKDESRVISSYRFPESGVEIFDEQPTMEVTRANNLYSEQVNHFKNMESNHGLTFEEIDPEGPPRLQSKPQSFINSFKNEIPFNQHKVQYRGERPSLPEINNVIQNLNTQENNDFYQSPKKNHIVEVNQVPLVFEHHYQGDYKNPRAKFVAHQYSYSPPADNSDEAYQLGRILSQNVVQKLQSAQKPLQEFVDDKQEVTLNVPIHAISSFSQQSYTTPRQRFSGSQFLHPLVKHLVPEMSNIDFTRDIRNFQNTNTNAYQIILPKTQTHPIVVEEEPIKPVYETTYLTAIHEPQLENNYHQSISQQYRTSSPYSVNVQQEFMDVPKYTLMSFFNLQDRIKPEAIHEVDPPNLATLNNFRNIRLMRNHAGSVMPEAVRTEILKTSEYLTKSPTEQHHQEDSPTSKWRSAIEIQKPQFIKYIQADPTPAQNLESYGQNPRTQMIQSRPYWRKPQIMKLVRIPEHYHSKQNYHLQTHQEQNIQEFEADPTIVDNAEVSYNNNNQQYSGANSQGKQSNENSPGNQDIFNQNPSEIIHLLPQHQTEESDVQHQHSNSISTEQEEYNSDKEKTSELKNVYFTQEPYENQVTKENPPHYTKIKQNKYHNELNQNKHQNIRTEVQIVKSVSPQYFQSPHYENLRFNTDYTRPRVEDEALSVELPAGYLNYQDQRSSWRPPTVNKVINTKHIIPSEKSKFREINQNLRGNSINPYSRLRRLVPNIPGQNLKKRNISYLVLMREDDER